MRYRIVNSREIFKERRFDGSYHNAESIVYDSVIKAHSSHTLEHYCESIFTSGRNKRAYTKEAFGYPFLSNSDASSQNPFTSCKYSSKKYGYDESALLKGGMILTGRVGAIGQTSFVPKFWETKNAMGSDNIIRILPKKDALNGYLYAYLASKMGKLAFLKYSTGGVQPFITESNVASLPIPELEPEIQDKVNTLILESAKLRGVAFEMLEKAHKEIENYLCVPSVSPINISGTLSIKRVNESYTKRFEGSYHVSDFRRVYDYITGYFKTVPLKDMSSKIFRPGIFKREYVKNGVMFLGGADIMMNTPYSDKQLSARQVSKMPELLVKPGWMLVTCGGTIGNVILIDEQLSKCAISQHVMRIVPQRIEDSSILFAFLSSNIGYSLINMFTYGAVIPSVEPHHVEKIPIPVFPHEVTTTIDELIANYIDALQQAKQKEKCAIDMVEAEIEKWNN